MYVIFDPARDCIKLYGLHSCLVFVIAWLSGIQPNCNYQHAVVTLLNIFFFVKWTKWIQILWLNSTFCRLHPAGEPPSPRAAHSAAAVGTMVVFQV